MNKISNIEKFDVIIVGAGAAGLMAAISAAKAGAEVLVLDHHNVPAKKILSTGNGKCNFTNLMQSAECYRCEDSDFVMHALQQFSEQDTLHFFEELGVPYKEKNGYCYPRTGQASTIRRALLMEAERLSIRIVNDVEIRSIRKNDLGFGFQAKAGLYQSEKCILATGGKAAPKTGSDGSGYIYAIQMGHTVREPLPALVAVYAKDKWLKDTAGVRCDAAVSLWVDGCENVCDTGELQMADYGLSGIPIFQISRYASEALANKSKVQVKIDFLPEIPEEKLKTTIAALALRQGSDRNWYDILSGFCHNKIAAMICSQLKLPEDPVLIIPEKAFLKQLTQIVQRLKHTNVQISGTRRFEHAQVTCGGVPVSELKNDMQSGLVPGLYFAGEIIDVDGICGGYNLQWAWTSGSIAGASAAESLVHKRD